MSASKRSDRPAACGIDTYRWSRRSISDRSERDKRRDTAPVSFCEVRRLSGHLHESRSLSGEL